MKLVYIAGAYRAKAGRTVEQNIADATQQAVNVCWLPQLAAWYPVTPHLNTAHFEDKLLLQEVEDEYWLNGTMEMMRRCDAVLLIKPDAAEHSTGTAAEVATAKALGIPVFRTLTEFTTYAKQIS